MAKHDLKAYLSADDKNTPFERPNGNIYSKNDGFLRKPLNLLNIEGEEKKVSGSFSCIENFVSIYPIIFFLPFVRKEPMTKKYLIMLNGVVGFFKGYCTYKEIYTKSDASILLRHIFHTWGLMAMNQQPGSNFQCSS